MISFVSRLAIRRSVRAFSAIANNIPDPAKAFGSRAAQYDDVREGYANIVDNLLSGDLKLHNEAVVADIGAGTGKLGQEFLRNGYKVYFVEPDEKMQRRCISNLSALRTRQTYKIISGTSDKTSIPDSSVDFIAVGDAAHWFIPKCLETVAEFKRILKNPSENSVLFIYRQLAQDNPFTYMLHEYFMNESKVYQLPETAKIIKDHSKKAEAVTDLFLDKPRRIDFSGERLMSREGFIKYLQTFSSLSGHLNDENNLHRVKNILDKYINDQEQICIEWGRYAFIGAPKDLNRQILKNFPEKGRAI